MPRYPLQTLILLATVACGEPASNEESRPPGPDAAAPATMPAITPSITGASFVGSGYRIEASLENARNQRTNSFSPGEEVWVRVNYAVEPEVAPECSQHADGPTLTYAADDEDIAAYSQKLARDFLSYLAVSTADELFRCRSVCLLQLAQPPPLGHGSVVVAPRFTCAGEAAPLLFVPLVVKESGAAP